MPKKIVNEDEALHEAIRMVAPGTTVREAISMILQAGTGAVLCFGDINKLAKLSEGGVELNAEMRPQLVYELSKMDGAIILNEQGTRIHAANRFLKPDTRIPSDETGTRHRVSQRLAAQAKCTVVTVSQRRSSVTVYCHSKKYPVRTVQALINKVFQGIQTLERYITTLQQTLKELTVRELSDWVMLPDVCRVLQRREMAERICQREVLPTIEELGGEGRLMALQVNELRKPLEEARMVLRDYVRDRSEDNVIDRIHALSDNDLLNLSIIGQALGYGAQARPMETTLTPRGYRVLGMLGTRFSDIVVRNLNEQFGGLRGILTANKEALIEVDGVGEAMADRLLTGLEMMRNQLNLDTRK